MEAGVCVNGKLQLFQLGSLVGRGECLDFGSHDKGSWSVYTYFFSLFISCLTQRRRMASLAKFRSGRVKILVATDVASR